MNEKAYFVLSALVFGVVGLLHLLRAALAVPVTVGAGTVLPRALSWLGAAGALALGAWGARLARRR